MPEKLTASEQALSPLSITAERAPSVVRSSRLARVSGLLLHPPVLLLLVVTLVLSRGINEGEFHFYNDETRHAFNGVFFRDLLVDLPLKHPVQYAYEYYAKYPAIAVPHWPPLFHLVEGVFFLVFGIKVWASRLAVLSFALLGVYFWYRIAERQGPRSWAFLSALIFACMPYVLLYERVIMLEIPSVALCLGTIHFWLRWVETERLRDLWLLAVFVAAAFLTSQTALFLPFFLGLHFLMERRFRLLKRWEVWVALAAALAFVLPWYLLSMRTVTTFSGRAIASGLRHFNQQRVWLFYFEKLPLQMGVVLLSLGAAGTGCALMTAARRYRFLLLWIFSCYLCFLLIPEKDPRHTMIWFPPLVYFALFAVDVLCFRTRWGHVGRAALALFLLFQAFRYEPPRVKGLEQVARYVLAQPGSDIVYYQGNLNGDFIFFVRKFDPEKSHMVARAKQVVVTQIVYDQRQILHTSEEVLNFFRTWGIRYAVLEGEDELPGLEPVRAAVHSGQFEFLRAFRVSSNDPVMDGRQVWVYRYRGELQRMTQPVVVPMMTIRNDIRADLGRLAGRPWPN